MTSSNDFGSFMRFSSTLISKQARAESGSRRKRAKPPGTARGLELRKHTFTAPRGRS